jgi:hypothetical protein
MTYGDIISSVKAAFRSYDLQDIRLYDINGEQLFDTSSPFGDIINSERIQVAVGPDQVPPSQLKREVVLFLEDDSLPKPFRVSIPSLRQDTRPF